MEGVEENLPDTTQTSTTSVNQKFQQIRDYINHPEKTRLVSLLALLVIAATIPVSVILVQQLQDIRQRAQTLPATPPLPTSRITVTPAITSRPTSTISSTPTRPKVSPSPQITR